jgi:hypothetical protein
MTFEDWFNEIENFGLRSERFYEQLDLLAGGAPQDGIVNWLKAAYQAGYEQGKYDSL